jgi:mannose-6-phosphate isomerase-like protein (cupin superfamily)
MNKKFSVAHFDEIAPTHCPCGETRRAFTEDPDKIASIHMVDIKQDSELHYHKIMTEIYLVLEGEGHMELDGELIPVRKGSTILIKPGCRHRAIGIMQIVNIPVPAFDPHDEWFD